ncbi:MAG: signal peptidase I [Burkholderiaceae bacterium]|jgi:signal peptidase I|nr:signal peptidase I [Burkholderiaceae bacterium]
MPVLTFIVLAAFVGYIGAWLFGAVQGNFELLLFIATVVTGLYWLAERFYFLPRRRAAAAKLEGSLAQRNESLARQGITQVDTADPKAKEHLLMQPWWLDWTAGLFPVILVVFLLRSFIAEPFKIPSGSMTPTLLTGDFILVNKFTYGMRLPVIYTKLTNGHPLQRGDVVVFRYPLNLSENYIKRVVGLPGDEVAYLNKRLTINGQPVNETPLPDYSNEEEHGYRQQFSETLGEREHRMLNTDMYPPGVPESAVLPFEHRENCQYSYDGVICKVPPGAYFMMGDNRDNSEDSRYWGFVPDRNIVGKAFFIAMNFSDLKRIGPFH